MTIDLTLKNCKLWYHRQLVDYGLAIDEGKISSITKDSRLPTSDEKIDCKGNIVLPGLIDVHVHFREPGYEWKEDWSTGSRAAAKGGITYVMEMPNTNPPTTTVERLKNKMELAKKKSVVNFGLYAGIGKDNITQIEELAKWVCGFKIYMAESTGDLKLTDYDLLEKAFSEVAKTGKVLCVHAEDQEIIEENKGKYQVNEPITHAYARPPEAEEKAIKKAIELAEKTRVKLHVCHLSSWKGLYQIEEAKTRGLDVTCETCPHYLYLTTEDMKRLGNLAKMNSPLRTKLDQDVLWKGIGNGTVNIYGSDHAPHLLKEKESDTPPSGVPGVETGLQLMLDAVDKGRIEFGTLLNMMYERPVSRFDLGNYGRIEKENNANLTIIDLNKEWEITRDELVTKCDWSPYEGWKGKGMPVMTIINGKILPQRHIRLT